MVRRKRRNLFIHLLVWLGILSLPFIIAPKVDFDPRHHSYPSPDNGPNWGVTVSSVLAMLFFYLNSYVLIPKIYFKKNTALYIFTLLLCVIAVCLIYIISMHFIAGTNVDFVKMIPIYIPRIFFIFFIVVVISFALKLNFQWIKTEQLKNKFERDKLNAELSFLKAQINPHFLFNTLNSIYTLSVKKSEKTPDAIIKLSNLMRYVISEVHQEYVSLEKEISYIESYIELEKIRLSASTTVNYIREGDLGTLEIAPMILISFIENAFKYGVSAQESTAIDIRLIIQGNTLELEVKNKKFGKSNSINTSTGIGIENSRTRLNMVYPGKHLLNLKDTEVNYIVLLKIELV